jgi:hypothetical protein
MSENNGVGIANLDRVAAGSAVVVAVGSAIYFHNRITELEGKVAEIQSHLTSIIPRVDPKIGQNLQQCVRGIEVLDRRINDLRTQLPNQAPSPIEPQPEKPVSVPLKKKYTRLTKSETIVDVTNEEDDPDVLAAVAALS